MRIYVFEVTSVYPIGQYQNAFPRVMPLHVLKKVQLQERFTLMTHGSIYLKTLCISIFLLSLNGNTAGHRSALKKPSILVWIQLKQGQIRKGHEYLQLTQTQKRFIVISNKKFYSPPFVTSHHFCQILFHISLFFCSYCIGWGSLKQVVIQMASSLKWWLLGHIVTKSRTPN